MAVSLALNWSPPASTSLFDDVSGAGDAAASNSSSPNGEAGTSRSNANALTSGRRPSAPPSSVVPMSISTSSSSSGSSSLAVAPQVRSLSSSPRATTAPKSYAAAAASLGSSPSISSLSSTSSPISGSVPAFGVASADGQQSQDSDANASRAQVGQSIHFPTATANVYTWQQYQQMVSQARQMSVSTDSSGSNAGGPRRRTTSGPQRAPTSFQDAHQQNPLPPLSYAPNTVPSHLRPDPSQPTMVQSNSASAVSGAGGYHPYRRTPRTSSNSAAVPVLPQIQFGSMLEPATPTSMSPSGSDGRTPTASGSASPAGAPSLSYSNVAAGVTRAEPAPASPATGPHPAAVRQGSTSTVTTSGNYPQELSQAQRMQARRPSDASSITSPGPSAGLNHLRNTSFSSQTSTSTERERPGVSAAANPAFAMTPSPLSQQAQPGTSTAQSAAQKKSLPGRLRKALSLSTMSEFSASAENNAVPSRATGRRVEVQRPDGGQGVAITEFTPQDVDRNGLGSSGASISSRRSARPPIAGATEGTSKRGIFNRKFNASTDNISISSTVSSASVMLRKMGNLGKMARRSSLMGLTNMFKDKDRNSVDGRDGLHTDDFGTMTASGAMTEGIENNAAQAAKVKAKRGKDKKAAPVAASITHATVELETGPGAMTPAASYVRQQQLQMQQLNEQGASAPNSPQGSSILGRVREARSKSQAAARATEAANISNAAQAAQGSEDRNQKMFEREKDRMKKQRGWKKMLSGGSSNTFGDSPLATPPTKTVARVQPSRVDAYPASDDEDPTGNGMTVAQALGARSRWGSAPSNALPNAMPSNTAGMYGEPPQDGMYDDDTADFLEPPHAPYADGAAESGDEYETDSLRHWGEGIERSRASAAQIKSVKSILKTTSAYGPEHVENNGYDRAPSFGGARMRSSSFDATQGLSAPGVPLMSQMSNTTEGTDRMDGLSTARADSPSNFSGVRSESRAENGGAISPPLASPGAGAGANANSNMGHHPNSSMPTLSLIMDGAGTKTKRGNGKAVRAPKKRLAFAESDIFHSTWPAHVYDRSGDLATCSRLTPALAQSIKEELNSFKMEEMQVAPTSRIYTHFFV
ncbi:hypothetical protein CF319_g2135 [Tilletia indica]|nr:hypothetical protein CF319_g2135 [Tilletia indica]